MSLFVHPFVKARLGCAAALITLAALVPAQAQSQTFTVSEPLLSLNGYQSFVTSNFNPTLGTLTDITLTLKIDNKTYTIFDANIPNKDWVDLYMTVPGKAGKVNADALSAWGNSLGNVDVSYTKPADKTVASMGVAGLLLYCTPKNGASNYISLNYTYSTGTNNPNGGGNPATPEPAAMYLGFLAAGVMAVLLANRSLRQRLAVKRVGASAADGALLIS